MRLMRQHFASAQQRQPQDHASLAFHYHPRPITGKHPPMVEPIQLPLFLDQTNLIRIRPERYELVESIHVRVGGMRR
jgi:hypothetical protein